MSDVFSREDERLIQTILRHRRIQAEVRRRARLEDAAARGSSALQLTKGDGDAFEAVVDALQHLQDVIEAWRDLLLDDAGGHVVVAHGSSPSVGDVTGLPDPTEGDPSTPSRYAVQHLVDGGPR